MWRGIMFSPLSPLCPSICLVYVRLKYAHPSVFSFPDEDLGKYQWIFAKLGMCIDIVEIWFGIANGQIILIVEGDTCPRHARILISR